jgi:hypothetical protein
MGCIVWRRKAKTKSHAMEGAAVEKQGCAEKAGKGKRGGAAEERQKRMKAFSPEFW